MWSPNFIVGLRLRLQDVMCDIPIVYFRMDGVWRDKNSSGDEIANVNFYAVRSGSYWNSLK